MIPALVIEIFDTADKGIEAICSKSGTKVWKRIIPRREEFQDSQANGSPDGVGGIKK